MVNVCSDPIAKVDRVRGEQTDKLTDGQTTRQIGEQKWHTQQIALHA